jgi:hypothetical protein
VVTSGETEKPLLLAAIDAVASIRPQEALEILDNLADSDDEDIVAAIHEAMAGRRTPRATTRTTSATMTTILRIETIEG